MGAIEVREDVSRELMAGERLVWSGRPSGGIRFRAYDLILIPFSFVWGGFAIFWEVTAWRTDAPLVFKLFGVPFVAVGLFITVGRFAVDVWLRARTSYALTDTRALIVSTALTRRVQSVDLRSCAVITLSERRDRSGTIAFGPDTIAHRGGRLAPPSFAFVEDARAVYEKVRATQSAR